MSDGTAPGTLRTERTFNGPLEVVFDAWTTAEVLREWWHAGRDWETPQAEVEPRVGGAIAITMRNPADGREYGGGGEFTVFDRPHRLACTWRWHDAETADAQLIEVDFTDLGEGRTKVVLTNSGLPAAEVSDYRDGWSNSLDNLTIALRRR
jgi:uncharacterized protein YndB with AHSA1/START domain